MVRVLPRIKIGHKVWIIDDQLQEIRNVEAPYEYQGYDELSPFVKAQIIMAILEGKEYYEAELHKVQSVQLPAATV